jgi:hypothetical protein
MKLDTCSLCVAVIMVSLAGQVFPQEAVQAQPEPAQLPSEFKAAAPDLFRAWLEDRPAYMKKLSLGQMGQKTVGKGATANTAQYVTFMDCQDTMSPAEYRTEMKETDSPPTMGLMSVPVKMKCIQNGAFTSALNADKMINMFAACVGATYEGCLAAGMKPMNRMMKAMWRIKGIGTPFSYEGEQHITYRWTEGKWEIQDQREEPPLRPD